jgi:hypothetical protein
MMISVINACFIMDTDLREDKYYLADHPGLVPVTTAQVSSISCSLYLDGYGWCHLL